MSRKTKVIGVYMVPFTKPGSHEPYEVMASKAVKGAIEDAGIHYSDIQQAYASYVYGDSTCGQRALYTVGMTGIPIINVNNNCSSGSTALFLARQAVESGMVDCALAVGFEEMKPGALASVWTDRTPPLGWAQNRLKELWPDVPDSTSNAIKFFGAAGKEYLEKYGANPDIFAKVSVKTRSHAIQNPYSLFHKPLTVEEVLNAPVLMPNLTRLMACPPTCGAAAAIVCSEAFAIKHGITNAVEIVGQALTTDTDVTHESLLNLVGADMTRRAADQVYEMAGIGPDEVNVVELHDCFTPNEVITYEGLGLCEEGGAEKFIRDGHNTYGGTYVVNPSGGLMSKGHPLGATGLAQCTELVWQLRGQADKRQVEGARVALQHNLGLGGACVVTMYRIG
ncbi:lipid-transfer protein [Brevibacillus brevis]|uniref:propanoyl-CoA C-acyltransferase n=1 Tax=Brevibacillus brevis TaxID=1393 RepID=A0A2Z4MI68_BREBE|nr:lipid-transfer protein [Brevibacillus brevis]AWX56202.1 lipid-transfer protein [Brevibacillus brevis]